MEEFSAGLTVGLVFGIFVTWVIFIIILEAEGDCVNNDVLNQVCQELFDSDYVYEEKFMMSYKFSCVHNKTAPQNLIYKEP